MNKIKNWLKIVPEIGQGETGIDPVEQQQQEGVGDQRVYMTQVVDNKNSTSDSSGIFSDQPREYCKEIFDTSQESSFVNSTPNSYYPPNVFVLNNSITNNNISFDSFEFKTAININTITENSSKVNSNYSNSNNNASDNNSNTDMLSSDSSDDTSVTELVDNEIQSSSDDDDQSHLSEQPEKVFCEQIEIKGYKLINKIGTGAFSSVFRAIPTRDNIPIFRSYKEVAVKCIRKNDLMVLEDAEKNNHRHHHHHHHHHNNNSDESSEKTSSRQQVLKEVTIQKMVSQCPNIVRYLDFQESKSYYFIIQEVMHGGEIFGEIVRLTYFSEDLCRHVITQLALAIKYLHSQGIVHRDIKPENLLFEPIDYLPLTPNEFKDKLRKSDDPTTKKDEGKFKIGIGGGGIGLVKLADFGLSKQIYSTNTKTPCGTVGYTAPEVVKDERYSMKVDMWGIGCVLYTMLCGFPPFYDERIDILTEKIARGEFTFLEPWWDEISNGAKNCVKKLLEVDPNKRYDVDDFLNDPWLKNYDCLKDERKNNNLDIIKTVSNMSSSTEHKKKKRYYNNNTSTTPNNNNNMINKDSTLLYSPAAVAMRDAFDISNAVQRQEEEKNNQQQQFNNVLEGIIEEEDDSNHNSNNNINNNGNGTVLNEKMFQLSLDTSTIVKRRKCKNIANA